MGYVNDLGVGEVLLTSIDNEGSMNGYDEDILKSVRNVNLPIILNGGAGKIEDIKSAIDAGADAVGVSSFFVFYGKKRAVLINTPNEEDYYRLDIYED